MGMHVHAYERVFLGLTLLTTGMALVAVLVGAFALGIDVPRPVERLAPADLAADELFSAPGVVELAPGRYRVVMIGQVWAFTPSTVEVPAGAEVTFVTTSRDVVHGLRILGTNINAMLVPGQVSEITHTFDEPGEHLIVCHEYCGVGHHAMAGKVIVRPAGQPVAEVR